METKHETSSEAAAKGIEATHRRADAAQAIVKAARELAAANPGAGRLRAWDPFMAAVRDYNAAQADIDASQATIDARARGMSR